MSETAEAEYASPDVVMTLEKRHVNLFINSFRSSLKFLRNIVPIAIRNIIYNRMDFDQDLLIEKNVCGIQTMDLKSAKIDHMLADIYFASNSIGSPITKKHLKEFYLIFKHENEIVEHYKFDFVYNKQPLKFKLTSKDLIASTKEFFDSIRSLSGHLKLNADTNTIMMELVYDNNCRPKKLPHFIQTYEKRTIPLEYPYSKLGGINTSYHQMQFLKSLMESQKKNTTDKEIVSTKAEKQIQKKRRASVNSDTTGFDSSFDTNDENREPIPVQSPQMSGNSHHKIQNYPLQPAEVLERCNVPDKEFCSADAAGGVRKKRRLSDSYSDTTHSTTYTLVTPILSDSSLDANEENVNIRCPCKLTVKFAFTDEIVCTICKTAQHSLCVGFEKVGFVPPPYVCIFCDDNDNKCTDTKLIHIKVDNWQFICLFRMTSYYVYKFGKIPEKLLELISSEHIKKTITEKLDLYRSKDKCEFSQKNILHFIRFMFHKVDNVETCSYRLSGSSTAGGSNSI